MKETLPVGKLPADLLARLLEQAPAHSPRLLLGPGVGLDCAVLETSPDLWVFKADPITFATDEIGWYAVQINANDIATSGAVPRWFLFTLLLPEGQTTAGLVEQIFKQVYLACSEIGVVVIGGHSEVTAGLQRPILAGTLIGEVPRQDLVTPRGASPGDRLLLTKGVPIEATSILAREFPHLVGPILSPSEISQAAGFLHDPGISVLREAQIALQAGRVSAMHDPTEGGVLGALWELAEASRHSLLVDLQAVPVLPLAQRICRALELDPLAAIASGSLIIAVRPGDAAAICSAIIEARIPCAEIGEVQDGPPEVRQVNGGGIVPRPARDEIARLFEA
jgi:hydrogenase maturation factor